jgi:hypothetical protein
LRLLHLPSAECLQAEAGAKDETFISFPVIHAETSDENRAFAKTGSGQTPGKTKHQINEGHVFVVIHGRELDAAAVCRVEYRAVPHLPCLVRHSPSLPFPSLPCPALPSSSVEILSLIDI